MASNRIWVVERISQIVKGTRSEQVQTAEAIVDLLMEEGLLHLGYGDADIDIIVTKFTDTFGTTKVSKYDRFAARRLASKYGSQAVSGIIQLLAEHSQEKYVPVVGSVKQLEEKIVSVLHFLRNLKGEEEIDV